MINDKVNIIIDTNLIFYKFAYVNAYKNNNYLSKPHHRSQLIKDITRSIEASVNQYAGNIDRVIFVGDCTDRSWRKDIPVAEEFYKATRSKEYPFDIVAFKTLMNNYLKLLREAGIYTYQFNRLEGDDLLFMVSAILHHNNLSSMIMTSDVDMYQLVKRATDGRFVYLFNYDMDKKFHVVPSNQQYIHSNTSDEFNGVFAVTSSENNSYNRYNSFQDKIYQNSRVFDSQEILVSKVLAGDSSDNIPTSYIYLKGINEKKGKKGTPTNFTEKRAKDVLKKYKTSGSPTGEPRSERGDGSEGDVPMVYDHLIEELRTDITARHKIAEYMIREVQTKAQKELPIDKSVVEEIGRNIERNIRFVYLHHTSYAGETKSGIDMTEVYKNAKLAIGKDLSNKGFLIAHRNMFANGWPKDIFRGTDFDIEEDEGFSIDFRS